MEGDVMLFYDALDGGRRRTHYALETTSDSEGNFRFAHLPPGNYKIAVSARPWYAQNRPLHLPSPPYAALEAALPDGVSVQANPEPETASEPSPLDIAYPLTFYPGTTEPEDAG